ncbi:uncharacterized protein LTR77_000323 [Saxophila tyrrhenica]|uniref:Uncharacterized protein n=1 Tax=Saxophila tyrrhenica TaxID=1690608 RepID=A0AAV9PN15_9PEZI|nr:hypothetical protein LTR77_000323 [Saxophila tyrrhenica]
MAATIDNKRLRNSTGSELSTYFRELHDTIGPQVVFKHLLDGVDVESFPPRVVTTWIHGFAQIEQLLEAMKFRHSNMVRRVAIRRFGLRVGSKQFPEVWKVAGGTEGLLQLMTRLSVHDVGHLCRMLGANATKRAHRELRQQCMTELVKALASDSFLESTVQNPDQRPLLKYYAFIVPACTVDLVDEWSAKDDLPRADRFRLYQAHTAHFQQLCLEKCDKPGTGFKPMTYEALFKCVPPEPATEKVSASMQFSLDFLLKLETSDIADVSFNHRYRDVGQHLLARLEKRSHTASLREDTLRCLLRAPVPQDRGGRTFGLDENGLFGYVIRLWKEGPAVYEYLLVDFLKCSHISDLGSVAGLLHHSSELNLSLLKLALLHLPRLKVRFNEDADVAGVKARWLPDIFLRIPKSAGSALLQRLIQLKPDKNFIQRRSSGLFAVDDHEQLAMLEVMLCPDEAEASQKAQKAAERCRNKATKIRDQDERAQCVASVVYFAVASRSLDFLEEIVLWLRKYNKDVFTVKRVYSTGSPFETEECLELLAGVNNRSQVVKVKELKEHVQHANRIMLLLLETACMGLREPSFYQDDWHSVIQLLRAVTERRTTSVRFLQDKLGLGEDQIYDAVFEDTLWTLVKAESIGLEDGHEKLGLRQANGPMSWTGSHGKKVMSRAVNCRLLDELAERRNELWEEHRKKVHSAVVALPEPWTKGLPIQSLLSSTLKEVMDDAMPYLLSRVEHILFLDSATALADQPNDKDTRTAIGGFVDKYITALRFYISANPQARQARTQSAWNHALENLTEPSMTDHEALHYWSEMFGRADADVSELSKTPVERPDPLLPDVEDVSEPTEWNPDPDPSQWDTLARPLRATCIQMLLNPPRVLRLDEHTPFAPIEPYTFGFVQQPRWQQCVNYQKGWKRLPPATQEALIAAALLLINSHCCAEKRLLAQPFPSNGDARFPALYLDDEFLDEENTGGNYVWPVVEGLKQQIPSSLGLELCKAMFNRPKGEKYDPSAFTLMKYLIESDRPEMFLKLIKHVIVCRPDDSSWHRHLFNNGLLRSLPSDVARDFLTGIADEIKEALQKRPSLKKEYGPNTTDKTGPVVKVSTVKMLAQIMSGADFVDEGFTVNLLVGLFTSSTHLDVRAAVCGSLISLMLSTTCDATVTAVLEALETHAVPIAASPSEFKSLSEADWEEAERSGTIPEVDNNTPIADALFQAVSSADESLRGTVIDRLLLPTLRKSAENNRRWMSVFLKQHHFDLSPSSLPPVPVHPSLLTNLIIRHTQLVPLDLLNIWTDAAFVTAEQDIELLLINETIRNSPDLRSCKAGRHWLNLWQSNSPSDYHGSVVTSLLLKPIETEVHNGITNEHVVQAFERQLDAVIMKGEKQAAERSILLQELAPPHRKNEDMWRHWQRYCRPLIRRFVREIDSMRTPEWQRDPDRKPDTLPDTYEMRLWLLTYPSLVWTPDHVEHRQTFANELKAEVERQASSDRPYHGAYAALKKAAMKAWPQDYCFLASEMGPLEDLSQLEELSVADSLRAELAGELVKDAKEPKDLSDATLVWEMLQAWRASPHEELRMRAIPRIREALEHDEKKWLCQS